MMKKKRAILKWKLQPEDYKEIEKFFNSCLQKHIFQSLEWTQVENKKTGKNAFIFVYELGKIICFACIEV
ncbi:MAG: hypothetical protein PVI26_12330, partial [Chitinispirillia bacterium]